MQPIKSLEELVWIALISEGNFELIEKLRKAERMEPGFTTIVVTKEGFSQNDRIHNMVLWWLKKHHVHVLDVMHEIGNLELAASSFCKIEEE